MKYTLKFLNFGEIDCLMLLIKIKLQLIVFNCFILMHYNYLLLFPKYELLSIYEGVIALRLGFVINWGLLVNFSAISFHPKSIHIKRNMQAIQLKHFWPTRLCPSVSFVFLRFSIIPQIE